MLITNIRKNAFWLFGVIVGLAIKDAITGVVPHLYRTPLSNLGPHSPELYRLATFLVLSIRFYLGAAAYFDEAYEAAESPDERRPIKKSYGLDFVFGITHFLLFYALAISINFDGDGIYSQTISPYIFIGILVLILLYDTPWAIANWKNDTFELIKMWVVLNLITVGLSGIILIFLLWLWHPTFVYLDAEKWILLPVFVFSVIDVAELITGKRIFEGWVFWIANKLQSLVVRNLPPPANENSDQNPPTSS